MKRLNIRETKCFSKMYDRPCISDCFLRFGKKHEMLVVILSSIVGTLLWLLLRSAIYLLSELL